MHINLKISHNLLPTFFLIRFLQRFSKQVKNQHIQRKVTSLHQKLPAFKRTKRPLLHFSGSTRILALSNTPLFLANLFIYSTFDDLIAAMGSPHTHTK